MSNQRTHKDLESVRWLAALLGDHNHTKPFSEASETVKGVETLVNRLKNDGKVWKSPGQEPLCLLMRIELATDPVMLRAGWRCPAKAPESTRAAVYP